jgi:PAS domain S-box-containing protein
LRASEERWRRLFECSSVGITVKDAEQRIVAANPAFQKMVGYSGTELQALTPVDLTDPDDRASTELILADLKAGRKHAHQLEKRFRRKDGSVFWADVSAFYVPATESAPGFFPAIVVDITERKRAEALQLRRVQANEVLKRSLNALARERQLDSVLNQVLVVLTKQLGGHSSTLWLIDAEHRRGHLHSVCQDGCVVRANASGHPNAGEPHEWSSDDPGWLMLQKKRPFVTDDPIGDVRIGYSPVHREYLAALGAQALVWIPLVFGEQLMGMLSVRMTAKCRVEDEALEFAQALAQQATLALELTRLAEQAKQTALAVERENAARQRAAQLVKANEALRGCLDALASVPELDDFLGQVMVAITLQLGAVSSTLRVLSLEQHNLTVELVFQEGRVSSSAEAKYPDCWQSLSLDDQRVATFLAQPTTVIRLLDSTSPLPEDLRSYLLGLGIKTLLWISLTSGGQVNGRLAFRFTEERDFDPEELEIARALATQASLAIQLTRLANAARQSAVLAERNRLAGEIHDALAQSFTGISMQLGVAEEELAANEGDPLGHIRRANEMAKFGLAEARRSVLSLRPGLVRDAGLITALQALVERSNVTGRLRCDFRTNGVPEERLSAPVQHELLRIAQEAISNALRHAQATVVTVTLGWDAPNLTLRVKDNGCGLARTRREASQGFGLRGMQERAARIGAKLEIQTAAGHGTSIIVRVAIST